MLLRLLTKSGSDRSRLNKTPPICTLQAAPRNTPVWWILVKSCWEESYNEHKYLFIRTLLIVIIIVQMLLNFDPQLGTCSSCMKTMPRSSLYSAIQGNFTIVFGNIMYIYIVVYGFISLCLDINVPPVEFRSSVLWEQCVTHWTRRCEH